MSYYIYIMCLKMGKLLTKLSSFIFIKSANYHQFHHSVLRQMINKYEAKRNHLIASLDRPVRPEESLDAVKDVDTIDNLAQVIIRAAHVRTGGDA